MIIRPYISVIKKPASGKYGIQPVLAVITICTGMNQVSVRHEGSTRPIDNENTACEPSALIPGPKTAGGIGLRRKHD